MNCHPVLGSLGVAGGAARRLLRRSRGSLSSSYSLSISMRLLWPTPETRVPLPFASGFFLFAKPLSLSVPLRYLFFAFRHLASHQPTSPRQLQRLDGRSTRSRCISVRNRVNWNPRLLFPLLRHAVADLR